jgi:hypothetical protein
MPPLDLPAVLFLATVASAFAGFAWIALEFCLDPHDPGFPLARRLRRALTPTRH